MGEEWAPHSNRDAGWDAPTCFSCKWWTRNDANIVSGTDARCRRRAPIPHHEVYVLGEGKSGKPEQILQAHTAAVWPLTEADDWCGDYDAAPYGVGVDV